MLERLGANPRLRRYLGIGGQSAALGAFTGALRAIPLTHRTEHLLPLLLTYPFLVNACLAVMAVLLTPCLFAGLSSWYTVMVTPIWVLRSLVALALVSPRLFWVDGSGHNPEMRSLKTFRHHHHSAGPWDRPRTLLPPLLLMSPL